MAQNERNSSVVWVALVFLFGLLIYGLFVISDQHNQIADDESKIDALEKRLASDDERISVLESKQATADKLRQDIKVLDGNLSKLQDALEPDVAH